MSIPGWASAVLVISTLLVTLGFWTYRAVENSLRELRAVSLASMLDAQVRSLEIWIENRKVDMRRVARDEQVRSQVEALARIAARQASASDEYCNAPARRPLVERLAVALEEQGAVAFNATDRSRRIIASRFREYCGLRLSEAAFERELAPVFKGETRFVRPYGESERLETSPKKPLLERPVTWFETPVRDAAGEIIASLGFAEHADGQFGGVLLAARTGETGEAYAFDRGGRLLSQPRFAAHVPAASPLALHAAQAAQGGLRDPYRSYHGGEVIGAWRWLPESKPRHEGETRPRPPVWHTAWAAVRHPGTGLARLLWIYGIGMFAFSAMTSILALYLGAEFGLDETTIGPIFTYIGILSFVMRSLLLGPIVDRLGEPWTMRSGTLLLVIGLLLYPMPRSLWTLALVIPLGILLSMAALLRSTFGSKGPVVAGSISETPVTSVAPPLLPSAETSSMAPSASASSLPPPSLSAPASASAPPETRPAPKGNGPPPVRPAPSASNAPRPLPSPTGDPFTPVDRK